MCGEEDGGGLVLPLRGATSWRGSLAAFAESHPSLLFIPYGLGELTFAWSFLSFRTGDPQFQ